MSPADIILERTLPNSVESKRAVLGAILLEQTALYPALEVMSQDDLYLEAHRHIFASMQSLRAAEAPIDMLIVKSELEKSDKLESAGGVAYLMTLTDGLPRAMNIRHYAGLVREQSIRVQELTEIGRGLEKMDAKRSRMWKCAQQRAKRSGHNQQNGSF